MQQRHDFLDEMGHDRQQKKFCACCKRPSNRRRQPAIQGDVRVIAATKSARSRVAPRVRRICFNRLTSCASIRVARTADDIPAGELFSEENFARTQQPRNPSQRHKTLEKISLAATSRTGECHRCDRHGRATGFLLGDLRRKISGQGGRPTLRPRLELLACARRCPHHWRALVSMGQGDPNLKIIPRERGLVIRLEGKVEMQQYITRGYARCKSTCVKEKEDHLKPFISGQLA